MVERRTGTDRWSSRTPPQFRSAQFDVVRFVGCTAMWVDWLWSSRSVSGEMSAL